jgi:N-acetylglutamate synthase-like GNAT family acetyltransferase
MSLSQAEAAEIAALLNARNQLTVQYTGKKVLDHADDYLFRLSPAGTVVACVEVKKVQWYQAEVLHLTVADAEVGKGHAKALLASAVTRAREKGTRLLQCTIREGNAQSEGLFQAAGFLKVSAFHNEQSGNNVSVFQKVLAHAR